jgi:RNA polymerase sigma-70 factor (ECF subfamily)
MDSPRQRAAQFERDVLPHLDRVYCAALCLAGDQAAADEVAQETFATACAAFGRMDPGANVLGWLYCILVSTFAGGTEGRQRSRNGPARRSTPTAAEIQAVERLPGADVNRALHELPPDVRIVVYLADVEGFGCREIADITAAPIGMVTSRLRRGRRHLGELLRDYASPAQDSTPSTPSSDAAARGPLLPSR